VQSGSTKVLNAMQRLYTREQYLERISWIKAAKRDISLTTDLIVGFPGETREEFEETIALISEVRYDGAFTFKYSPRPNTASLNLPDVISDEEKTLRLSILNERQKQISLENNKRHLNQMVEAMVEGRNEARKQWNGRTSQNKVLNFTAPEAAALQVGSYVQVRVTQSFSNSLVGELAV
jgi:tRNA-2-methylthio-N6-dimethylallyladenosine synthase